MASFTRGPVGSIGPFGKNEYLRSTRDLKFESYTFAKGTVTPDANGDIILQPGTVLAKITSGADVDKVGPYSPSATDGRQTAANIVGLDETFLPWQLKERDVEVAVLVGGRAVQAWCLEVNASGNYVPLTDATAAAMVAKKSISILFA